jgi:hypothetical protein
VTFITAGDGTMPPLELDWTPPFFKQGPSALPKLVFLARWLLFSWRLTRVFESPNRSGAPQWQTALYPVQVAGATQSLFKLSSDYSSVWTRRKPTVTKPVKAGPCNLCAPVKSSIVIVKTTGLRSSWASGPNSATSGGGGCAV